MKITWKVIETACFPCSWKVVPNKGIEPNDLRYYFESKELAQAEAET
jgi:hypothetical protein